MQDDDWGNLWVGSEIICLKPCVVVRESICVRCKVLMSLDHHAGDLALRSPKMCMINQVLQTRQKWFKFRSALTATCPFLFCIVTSQTRHSVKMWCLQYVLLKTLCNKYKHHLSWCYLDDHFKSNYSLLSWDLCHLIQIRN